MIRELTKVVLIAAVVTASAARADGLLLSPSALPEASRKSLADEIAQAKKKSPEAFEKVRRLAATVPTWDARKRGRIAPVSPVFKGIGADALWPMVELIAFDAPSQKEWKPSASLALALGLVEAASATRDVRLAPLWIAILDGRESRPELLRATVESLGKLETDQAAAKLIALSKTDGPKRDAALAGMGQCRRPAVARALSDALDARPDELTAKTLARALGDIGNAWAWKAQKDPRSEEAETRELAAKALLRAYLAYEGEARQAASNALLVVDAPVTPALISTAKKGANEKQLAALETLSQRWAKNPVR